MPRQLIIGLPASGKTTFIGALWALLNAPSAPTRLKLRRLAGSRDRLEALARKWLAGEAMGRTELQTEGWVELFLETSRGVEVQLGLPDLSGESFDAQWRDRRCGTDYRDAAAEADGLLLFVHAKHIRAPRNLADIAEDVRVLYGPPAAKARAEAQVTQNAQVDEGGTRPSPVTPDTPPSADADGPKSDTAAIVPFHPDLSPTQSKVVDLLQILCEPQMGRRKRRLGIVLSAWDLAEGQGWRPDRYMRELLPLLDQYLSCNQESFETRVFGVSCQGMDRDDQGFAESVGREVEDRITVDDGISRDHDLTRLLLWASGDG